MRYDLSFDKRSAVLLATCGAVIAVLLVAAGFLIGIRHTATTLPSTPALSKQAPIPTPDQATTRSAPLISAAGPATTPSSPENPAINRPNDANFALQFGAFQDQANAQARVKELKEKGITATVLATHDLAGRTLFAVRSGSYTNASDAAAAARDLQRATQERVIIRPAQRF